MALFTAVKAQGTVTGASTWIVDGDTLQIGSTTYRFKNTPAQLNDIYVQSSGTSAHTDTALANLVAAINGTGTAGATTFYTGTLKHKQVKAAVGTVAHTVIFTALNPGTVGNLITFVATSSGLTVDAAVLGTTTAGTGDGNADIVGFVTYCQTYVQNNSHMEKLLEEAYAALA